MTSFLFSPPIASTNAANIVCPSCHPPPPPLLFPIGGRGGLSGLLRHPKMILAVVLRAQSAVTSSAGRPVRTCVVCCCAARCFVLFDAGADFGLTSRNFEIGASGPGRHRHLHQRRNRACTATSASLLPASRLFLPLCTPALHTPRAMLLRVPVHPCDHWLRSASSWHSTAYMYI